MSAKEITLKPSGSCMCDTIKTAVEAGITDLCLETEFRIKLDEVVRIDIPLNVECKCTGINVKPKKPSSKSGSCTCSDSD